MPQARFQSQTRVPTNLIDQHGREYLVSIDLKTGDPTGGIDRCGFSDPLKTPNKYLVVPRKGGRPQYGKLNVAFDRWIQDQTQAQLEWVRRLWEVGRQHYKNKFDAKIAEQDDYLLDLAGPKPFPTVEVLKMAQAGDGKLLGFEPLDREYRILLNQPTNADLLGEPEYEDPQPESYQQFATRLMKEGKKMEEVGALWQEQKLARV